MNNVTKCFNRYLTLVFAIILFSSVGLSQALPNVNHQISKETAVKMIKNFKASPAAGVININAGAFTRGIVDSILAQNGCVGVRIYYGQHDDGKPTFILVGVDSIGNDLTEIIIAQLITPCPPYCGILNTLSE